MELGKETIPVHYVDFDREWTSSGPKSKLEGGLVRGGRSGPRRIEETSYRADEIRYREISAELLALLSELKCRKCRKCRKCNQPQE